MSAVRDTAQRVRDVQALLHTEEDAWVPSASESGEAYIVPLSFSWDGETITLATPRASRTAANLRRAGRARIAIGPTRDVVIIEGPVVEVAASESAAFADEHARVVGFDARHQSEEYVFIRLTPDRILAWRNPAELPGRVVMRGGCWLA